MEGACNAEQEFIFRGELSETPLPRMMATVHRHGVPGVLNCSQGDDAKRVFFLDGDVIFATSTDRVESLGDYLLRQGKITKAQYRVSSDELRRSPGKRHGTVLVEMGFLEKEQLGVAVREQVQHILWSLFNWEQGDVSFSVGRFRDDEVYQIRIPTPRAILSGCKRIQNGKRATANFGGRNSVLYPCERPDSLKSLRLEVQERRLLEMVNGKRSVIELCENGPLRPGLNARVLYAFLELGLIESDLQRQKGAIKIQVQTTDPE